MQADNDNSKLPRTRAEAKAAGNKLYFTGEPCKYGHIAPRYTTAGCVECAIARATERYWSDTQAKKEYDRIRYATNPKARIGRDTWKINNPEKAKECSIRWRENNPEKHKDSQRKWALNNPETVQSNVRARRARKRNAEGHHTKEDIERLLIRQNFKCAECGTDIRKRASRQVDHIMPLKLGGTNWPHNLQLLCSTCNKVKAAKHPLDFAAERGRLV
ncbi:HNH endonuclease [Mesorhizobium sp. ESP-6-4]|uniref:HNH endonuclease n=1 Tax=Mesorhizobium sp. ESP-6-4 TaxID=2876624 RepID=UPI001CCBA4EF|nr:HNH endonuclease [Mesorhizobium sp. ESP-6-4]